MKSREWRLSADRMKARQPHVVPLSDRALDILVEVRDAHSESEIIFPGKAMQRKRCAAPTFHNVS